MIHVRRIDKSIERIGKRRAKKIMKREKRPVKTVVKIDKRIDRRCAKTSMRKSRIDAGFFAENDDFVTPKVARKLEADLKAAGKSIEIHIYSGAHHAFFNDDRPEVYHERYAKDSWDRMLVLFRSELT